MVGLERKRKGKERKNSTQRGDRVGVATIFDLLRLKFWKKRQPALSSVSSMSVHLSSLYFRLNSRCCAHKTPEVSCKDQN